MTYDFETARGGLRFKANMSGIRFLRAAIVESGVNLKRRKQRSFAPKEKARPMRGDLMMCFDSNSGFHVMPDECREIAERIEAALPGWIKNPKVVVPKSILMVKRPGRGKGAPPRFEAYEEMDSVAWFEVEAAEIGANPRRIEFVRRFVLFCREASLRGGFFVY